MGWKNKLLIEIIGPAGAGKSTVCNALLNNMEEIYIQPLPPVWDLAYSPFFIKNIIQILPRLFLSITNTDRFLSRRELAWMAILNGWPKLLNNQHQKKNVILFDQGPLFLMAILMGYGPQFLNQIYLDRWWKNIFLQWSQTIDVIIWLDTNDNTLINRIDKRESDHIIKGKPDKEVHEFFAKYRVIFENIVKEILNNNQKIQLIRIESGQNSLPEVMDIIISKIESWKKKSI